MDILIGILIVTIAIISILWWKSTKEKNKEIELWRSSNTENLIIVDALRMENRYLQEKIAEKIGRKRVYISGKITGIEEEAKEKFARAEKDMITEGLKPINPMHMAGYDLDYSKYMQIDLTLLETCSAIYMLENWKDSKGAKIERDFALSIGLEVIYEGDI